VRLTCWLKSVIVPPRHLTFLGSLFDFAGPGVSRKFRLFLFRMFGGALAADFYLYRSKTRRLPALFIGLVSGALCQVKSHHLESLPEGGFLLCGCALTIWYPLIEGLRSIAYWAPAIVEKSAELVERYEIRLLVTTPNSLRGDAVVKGREYF
jgi:hypothetical protein